MTTHMPEAATRIAYSTAFLQPHLFDDKYAGLERRVFEFHAKHGFDRGVALRTWGGAGSAVADKVRDAAESLERRSKELLVVAKHEADINERAKLDGASAPRRDLLALRAHLILEEVAELLFALANCDEVGVLDGAADSAYVIAGACVAAGLPLSRAVAEVCDSNDTKQVKVPGDLRLRTKGASYKAPNLEALLREHSIVVTDLAKVMEGDQQ